MLNEAVAVKHKPEAAVDEITESKKSTDELLDDIDDEDRFTPMALQICMAKGENGDRKETSTATHTSA
jgi:hypothetical protein